MPFLFSSYTTPTRHCFKRSHVPYITHAHSLHAGENAAFRFVCKRAHRTLLAFKPHLTTPINFKDGAERDEHVRSKASPYVSNLAIMKWAVESINLPLNENVGYAAIQGKSLEVVQYLKRTSPLFPFNVGITLYAGLCVCASYI